MALVPPELPLSLTDDELAFFRFTCDLFPTAESPLYAVDDPEPGTRELAQLFAQLRDRKLLSPSGAGAVPELHDRLEPVSECNARVVVRYGGQARITRDYYV